MDLVKSLSTGIKNRLENGPEELQIILRRLCDTYLYIRGKRDLLSEAEFENLCREAIPLHDLLIVIPILQEGGTPTEAATSVGSLWTTLDHIGQLAIEGNGRFGMQEILDLLEKTIAYSKKEASLPELLKGSTGNCEAMSKYVLFIMRILFPTLYPRIRLITPNKEKGYSGADHMQVVWKNPESPGGFYTADPLEKTHVRQLSSPPIMDAPPEYVILERILIEAEYIQSGKNPAPEHLALNNGPIKNPITAC